MTKTKAISVGSFSQQQLANYKSRKIAQRMTINFAVNIIFLHAPRMRLPCSAAIISVLLNLFVIFVDHFIINSVNDVHFYKFQSPAAVAAVEEKKEDLAHLK